MINTSPNADHVLANTLAKSAGAILLNIQQSGLLTGKALGDAGDQTANTYIMNVLRNVRPNDGILSEESTDDKVRLDKSRVWIIDPLDGTREFAEGRPDWAVHIGLAINGVAEIGAVALPGLDVVYCTGDAKKRSGLGESLRLAVSRTRPAKSAKKVANALSAALVPMGSAGFKAMAVVRGEVDAYVHDGGQYQWDNCAPVAVARAHGLHCSRVNGDSISYNQVETSLPDLVICRPDLAMQILTCLNA